MLIACTLINGAALVYGGITDYKRREIPNLVPIILLVTGLVSRGFILQRLLMMLSLRRNLLHFLNLIRPVYPCRDSRVSGRSSKVRTGNTLICLFSYNFA